ncbi:MAG: RusA family crossover junction endodeoxyribonuclease [bacterium]|nr:RusA family crossover junction endodeoxyribonuclease [bacterium]
MSGTRAERAKALEEWTGRVDAAGLRHADTEALRETPFEFVIEGPAVSQQARDKQRLCWWKEKVKEAAGERWMADPLTTGSPVTVSITYFSKITYTAKREPSEAHDVDNLAKPILDAMMGIVYYDDSQVSDLLVRIRGFETQIVNQPAGLAEYLRESRSVVHVSVDPAPSPRVEF